ncbi:cilia- and flagella-associated protein 251-like isoform X2 [Cylas formicarius]|nr:cilia- and flagella-associated protein 251-like isoform X2 [Cylas formicarius]
MARETPPDKNLEGELAGKFFVSTADCNIYVIDFADGKCDPIFHIADANVTAVDAHDEKPYLAVGYENGRISLINFESKEQINTATLPKTDENPSISCIKYSLNSLHLICGRYSGEICILEPVTLEHKFCFKCTKSKVEKIAFSRNCLQFACYDYNKTVVLFRYDPDSSRWELQGKLRSHYDLINDLMFIPSNDQAKSVLCTIGCDRYLVQYITDLRDGPFRIKSRHRIEQTAVPMNFLYFVKDVDENRSVGYILIADDKHKLKFLHEATKIPRALILGPAFGCFDESHIRKMEILPHHSSRYMIFVCQKRLGLQILPPDGNPFKYTGYLAQPNEVKDFTISHDGRSVFTFGGDDRCILQWEVKPRSVEVLRVMGGTELEPFYCLLEGGKNGWLFQEMQDLFFYMQILQQDNIDLPRRMSDSLNISELPDLVRTCGYYPSDFELELLLLEAKYQDFDETGVIRDEISFVEFAKLFANHRPAYGYSSTHMREIFDVIAGMAEFPQSGKIETSEFLYLLQSVGEPCINLHKHLATLLRTGAVYEENNYEFLPEEIDAKFLFDEMLGICKSSSPRQVEDEDEQ